VPINIQSDGAFGVRLTVASDQLSDRERAYALVSSEPYLLAVTGGDVSSAESKPSGRRQRRDPRAIADRPLRSPDDAGGLGRGARRAGG
jgi:hypothetical protein